MRRREGLVQVQVHHVHAEISWSRDACKSVHVGSVHVKQSAFFVQYLRNLRDAFLKYAESTWVGQHQRGDVLGDEFAEMVGVDLPARVGANILHLVTRNHYRCRVRSVGGVGYQDFLARIAFAREISANHQEASELALRTGRWL